MILDTPSVNLLVVGTDAEHTAIVATSGLLSQLSRVELEGVVARAFVQLRQGDVFSATMGVRLEAAPATRIFASVLGHNSSLGDPDRDVLLDRSAAMLTRLQKLASINSLALWRCDMVNTACAAIRLSQERLRLRRGLSEQNRTHKSLKI